MTSYLRKFSDLIKINRNLLPSKLFYVSYYAGLWTFLPVYAHYLVQQGFSPADLTILLGLQPFALIFSRLILGDYADRSGRYKLVMICCLTLCIFSITSLYFVPSVSKYDDEIQISNVSYLDKNSTSGRSNALANVSDYSSQNDYQENTTSKLVIPPYVSNNYLNYDALEEVERQDPGHSRFTHFSCYETWLVFVLFLAAYPFGMLPAVSLVDTLTLGLLKDKPHNFGKQRLWMVFGATFTVPFIGFISDKLSQLDKVNNNEVNIQANYLPSFVCFVTFLVLACVSISYIRNPFATVNGDGSKRKTGGLLQFWPIFKKQWRIQLFVFVCFVYGINFGQSIMLFAVHMKELGSSQLLVMTGVTMLGFGLSIMLFLSGRIINVLGHEFTLCVILAFTATRSFIWFMASSHWCFLVTEPTFGLCFGLMIATVGSYAKKVAPAGAEATAQSIVSTAYEGLGAGIGQIISGSIHHTYDAATSWVCFSIFTIIIFILYFVVLMATKETKKEEQDSKKENTGSEMEISGVDTYNLFHESSHQKQ